MKMSFPANWAAPFSIAHARDFVVKLLNDELGFGIMAHRRLLEMLPVEGPSLSWFGHCEGFSGT